MITLDEALADCQNSTSDTTSASQAIFLTGLNQGYQNLIAMFGRPGIEKTINTTTNLAGIGSATLVDSNRSYQLPPDYQFLKTARVQIGSRWYNLIEEEAQEMWNYRTEYAYGGIPSLYFINQNFGVSSAELQIDPIATATTTTGNLLTPTVATYNGTTLTLTFTSIAANWVAGATVTLANFVLANGQNINGSYLIATSNGSTQITITIAGTTSAVSTIGTVGTTIGVPLQIVYESSDVRLDHLGTSPTPGYSFENTLAGNMTFTNGSNLVSSSVPAFSNWMQLGSTYITAGDDGDGNWYKIVNVNSSTSITIGNVYQNTTVTSGTYWSINQIMSLHVDMQDIPEYWALWKYYLYKKDAKWRDYYKSEYMNRMMIAKGNWATKSRSSIIRSKNGLSRWHSYPGWFPAVGVSS